MNDSHSHCFLVIMNLVPKTGAEANEPLYKWIEWQRLKYASSKMEKSREELLNSIGFEWEMTIRKKKDPGDGR